MFKQADILFLYAETGVHIGGGESLGAIDLAIQRERYTDFPVGPSSGVKGAVRDWFVKYEPADGQKIKRKEDKIKLVFGPDNDEDNASDHAGAVAFTDARVLLFPVRSMKGVFAWITCPTVLRRLQRDLKMAGQTTNELPVPDNPDSGKLAVVAGSECLVEDNQVVLEEFVFQRDESADAEIKAIAEWLSLHAFPQGEEYDYWRDRLSSHLLLLRDDDFTDFARHSTDVQARIKLGEGKSSDTKKGGNLFYEEFLPCDTLMYSIVLTQDVLGEKLNGEGEDENEKWGTAGDGLDMIRLMQNHRLQIGADESIGKGIMCVHFMNTDNK